MSEEDRPIIIKKVIKKGGGHHGGAWKVAYADFVTAMMAFFLLLWLLNVVTSEAKDLISSYFDPSHPMVSRRESGSGGVLGGLTVNSEGSMTDDMQPMNSQIKTGLKGKGETEQPKVNQQFTYDKDAQQQKKLEDTLRQREDARFEKAKEELEKAIRENEGLQDLAENLQIDITPEGLRIQIIDQDGDPMFPTGSAEMYPKTRELTVKVAEVISDMPNDISIRGHTDAVPYGADAAYTNWELSSDRANTSRKVLAGTEQIEPDRFVDVIGKEDNEPFIEEDPYDARNRRISIILKREKLEDAIARGAFDDAELIEPEDPENAVEAQDDATPQDVSTENNADLQMLDLNGAASNEQTTTEPVHPDEVPRYIRRKRDKGFEKSDGEFFFP